LDTTQIKIKDLKGFGDIQIPFLSIKGNQEPKVVIRNLSELDENMVITVHHLVTKDYDLEFSKLIGLLLAAKRNNEPSDKLLKEIDEVYNKLDKDSKFLTYMASFEENYPGVKEKKPKEYKIDTETALIERTDLDIPTEAAIITIEPIQKIEQVKPQVKVEPQKELFDITPNLKNDGSLRDEIIKLSYKGLVKPIDGNNAEDILGRWWDLDALSTKIEYGDILVEALLSEQYPPYLSNINKDELEYINNKFIEIKGRKPFETI